MPYGKVTKHKKTSQTRESKVSPFPAGDHKAVRNKQDSNNKDKDKIQIHKRSTASEQSVKYFFCGSFMFLFCLVFCLSLCASVYMCLVVTCWERADPLALVCGV